MIQQAKKTEKQNRCGTETHTWVGLQLSCTLTNSTDWAGYIITKIKKKKTKAECSGLLLRLSDESLCMNTFS